MEPTPAPVQGPAPGTDLNDLSLAEFAQMLRASGLPGRLLTLARDEDLGSPGHDWTGELMFAEHDRRGVRLRSRDEGIAAGLAFMPDLIGVFTPPGRIGCQLLLEDGSPVSPGTTLARLEGNARAIVRLERTMLNLISRMSGIATRTRRFVTLVEGTGARICDTRKTTPGLRAFEKYAVRCGGGTTHRMGLHDAVLIKDNHLAGLALDEITSALERVARAVARRDTRPWFVQVEVDSIEQLGRVFEAGRGVVDLVLLDNMTTEQLAQAVVIRDRSGHSALLEASGGVNERTVAEIARTGVDRISIGGLTHQATSLDLGLDAD